MNDRTSNRFLVAIVSVLCLLGSGFGRVHADSAMEILAGFDKPRVEAAYPPTNSKTFSELAKIVYRLGRVQRSTIESRLDDTGEYGIGDAISIQGRIQSLRTLKVPDELVEFLEFPVFQDIVLELEPDDGGGETQTINVIARRLPKDAKTGDRIAALGVTIEEADNGKLPVAMASMRLKWFPSKPPSNGWRLLSEAGVDVSELANVATRNREHLETEDAEPFYQILSAAQGIGRTPLAAQLEPKWVKPVDLLQKPKEHAGDWMRMRLNTVRVTRVAVTDPIRQKQLGDDHYFQIDANGDLGNVVVKLARAPDDPGEPITFDGTYPVSLVMTKLPDFLRDAIRQQEGGDAVAAMISKPVQVEGFFFRLWSYSSDFMERKGGGDQFGPLLMVANMTDRSQAGGAGGGVAVIGYIAAIAIITGLIGAILWTRQNAGEDREVREKQQERESSRLDLQ